MINKLKIEASDNDEEMGETNRALKLDLEN